MRQLKSNKWEIGDKRKENERSNESRKERKVEGKLRCNEREVRMIWKKNERRGQNKIK